MTIFRVGVDKKFTKIMDAYNYAENGDTLFIDEGTYIEYIHFKNKVVNLIGNSQNSYGVVITSTGVLYENLFIGNIMHSVIDISYSSGYSNTRFYVENIKFITTTDPSYFQKAIVSIQRDEFSSGSLEIIFNKCIFDGVNNLCGSLFVDYLQGQSPVSKIDFIYCELYTGDGLFALTITDRIDININNSILNKSPDIVGADYVLDGFDTISYGSTYSSVITTSPLDYCYSGKVKVLELPVKSSIDIFTTDSLTYVTSTESDVVTGEYYVEVPFKSMYTLICTLPLTSEYRNSLFRDNKFPKQLSTVTYNSEVVNLTGVELLTNWIGYEKFSSLLPIDIEGDYAYTYKTSPERFKVLGVKTFILDVESNWSEGYSYTGVRKIEFLDVNGNVINIETNFTAYAADSFFGVDGPPTVFRNSTTKFGSSIVSRWLATTHVIPQTRLLCVFTTPVDIYGIVINNLTPSLYSAYCGAKDIKLYVSTIAIINTVYGSELNNCTKIYDGHLNMHVDAEVLDEQIMECITEIQNYPLTYKFDLGTCNFTNSDYITLEVMYKNVVGNCKMLMDLTDQNNFLLNSSEVLCNPHCNLWSTLRTLLPVNTSARYLGCTLTGNKTQGALSFTGVRSIILDFKSNWGNASNITLSTVRIYDQTNRMFMLPEFSGFYSSLPSVNLQEMFDFRFQGIRHYWGVTSGVRIVCTFPAPVSVYGISVVNAFIGEGPYRIVANVDVGVKDLKVYVSSDVITNPVYGASIPNSTVFFEGQLRQHVGGSAGYRDEQHIGLDRSMYLDHCEVHFKDVKATIRKLN